MKQNFKQTWGGAAKTYGGRPECRKTYRLRIAFTGYDAGGLLSFLGSGGVGEELFCGTNTQR